MRRLLRGSALAIGCVVVVFSVVMIVARQVGVTQITAVAILVGTPFAAIPAAVAVGLFAAAKSRTGVVVAAALTLLLVGIQVPQFIADEHTASGAEITVFTVNVAHGEADADAIVEAARNSDADFVAVQELTQDEADRLEAAGIGELLPYSFTAALPVADGTGLWSKTPLTDATRLSGFGFVPVQASTVVGGIDLTVVSFHAMSPATPRHAVQWAEDLAHMRRLMDSYPGTVVVAGDFNATGDHRQFRDLTDAGFRDAAESAGAGLFRTFPSDTPLARLDHVVTSERVDALGVEPVTIPNSDHLGVVSRLRLPASNPAGR